MASPEEVQQQRDIVREHGPAWSIDLTDGQSAVGPRAPGEAFTPSTLLEAAARLAQGIEYLVAWRSVRQPGEAPESRRFAVLARGHVAYRGHALPRPSPALP